MKVDFRNIVIKDINGNDLKADVTEILGNLMYMQGQNINECELAKAIYHQGDEDGEEMELNDKQVAIVRVYAERLPYVFREGIKNAVQ